MVFIDTHCHIDMMKDIDGIVERAITKDVKIILNNGVDIKSNRKTLELAEKYKEVKSVLGIYPIDALKMSDEEIEKEIEFIRENKEKIIGIGEVGIDLKWSKDLEKQKPIFEKFIDLAKELDKPLIVHSREAEEKVMNILKAKKAKKVVIHCFNGELRFVNEAIERGWFFSIPANICFSENFQKLVEKLPLENILCETDSPYLHPIKGERNNEPGNVIESYKKIAKIKGLKLEEVEKNIENNFKKIFGLQLI